MKWKKLIILSRSISLYTKNLYKKKKCKWKNTVLFWTSGALNLKAIIGKNCKANGETRKNVKWYKKKKAIKRVKLLINAIERGRGVRKRGLKLRLFFKLEVITKELKSLRAFKPFLNVASALKAFVSNDNFYLFLLSHHRAFLRYFFSWKF